jgi:acetyl-CoA decarbonylase/synthase, CODH/ACS complex subunit delta
VGDEQTQLIQSLIRLLAGGGELELERVTFSAKELTLSLSELSGVPGLAEHLLPEPLQTGLADVGYHIPARTYPGRIGEVVLGSTRGDGGSRVRSVTIGGATAPPFHLFEGAGPHVPVVAGSVFDIVPPLPGPVKSSFGDAVEDPCAWAKAWVDRYGADLIDLDLISTDPYLKDTPVKRAVGLVEDLLQAVDVPLIIGGSGNPEKDAKLLPKVAEVCAGERILLSSATTGMWEPVAKAAQEYNHVVLAWSPIDINQAKELNRKLMGYLPPDQIVMDPTSAALGYGLEYSFSVMERIRLAGLMGDKELQCPQASGTANSWGAREAWKRDDSLGPREYRGPLWETTGALAFLLAGVDLFIMVHPGAARTIEDIVGWLAEGRNPPTFPDFIGVGR